MRSRNVIISLLLVVAVLAYTFVKMQFWEPRKKMLFKHYPSRIDYSRLALCRMDCFHIGANDITDIVNKGEINSGKSDLHKRPCPIFTVEGFTKTGLRLIVIVVQCGNVATIANCFHPDATLICHCPEDKNQPISFHKTKY